MTTTATALPRFYEASLCRPTTELPVRLDDWWMEPKLDGIRLQMVARDGEVHSYSRSGQVWDGRLPEIEAKLALLDVVIDGEVVWLDPVTDQPDFHKGSGLFRRDDSAARQRWEGPLTFMVFDLLEVAGQDIRRMAIETRRGLLAQLVQGLDCPQIRLVEQATASAEKQVEYIAHYREGIVLKRKNSTYAAGRAPGNWLKMKVVADADVVIMDVERGQGKYSNTLGCVVFGQYDNGVLTQRGTCSGMTDAERDDIWRFPERYVGKVLVIRHMGNDGVNDGFRHPQWDHMRAEGDKSPEECTWD